MNAKEYWRAEIEETKALLISQCITAEGTGVSPSDSAITSVLVARQLRAISNTLSAIHERLIEINSSLE